MSITSRIEFAFGADLTANPATWTWTDVSQFALGSVRVSAGRADEASQVQPTACAFRLRNTDARFTPRFPTSQYYPYMRRQTPVRVSLNPGTGYTQRFQGFIDDIVPSWPAGNSQYAEVTVTASGSLRRLGQGSNPLQSPLRRAIAASGPIAYWPLEEGPAAGGFAATSGAAASSLVWLMATGPAEFGAVRPLTGAASMPSFIRGGALDLQVNSTVSSSWTVEFAYCFGVGEPAPADYTTPNAMNVLKLFATNGDYWLFQLSPHNAFFTGGRIALFRSDEPEIFFDTLVDNALGSYNPWDGQTHHVAIAAAQVGSDLNWKIWLDGVEYAAATLGSRTLQAVNLARLNANGFLAASSTYGLGHFAILAGVIDPADHATAARGYAGETAGARIARLCAEQGVPVSVSSTTGTIRMGPQKTDTFLSLLRECEAADGGVLYDGTSAGLSYLAGVDRYNLAVSMALDCLRQQVKLPFTPAEDDQRIRNDWTVTRPSANAPVHFADAVHIAANGLYDTSAIVNVQYDIDLLDQAAWRVHLGTVAEMRVPGLSLELIDHPELWASWLATTLGERVTAVNLPVQYPPGTLDMIVEGYVETWDAVSWRIVLNTSPFAPWRIFTIAADTGDTGAFVGHLDTDDSALGTAITTTANSIIVKTNSGPIWTTVADDFPFDLNVGGERITATAAADSVTDFFDRTAVSSSWGNAAPTGQTWNLSTTASAYSTTGTLGRINTATTNLYYATLDTLSVNQTVRVEHILPVVPTGAGFVLRTVARWLDFNNYYEAELHIAVGGAATLNLRKGVGGVGTVISGSFALPTHSAGNLWITVLDVSGSTVSAKAWDFSIGDRDPGGWQVSVTDTSLTTGTQAGAGVQREVGNTNGATNVDFNNFVVSNPQTFTVTRSVNGVSKAHAVSAPVSLWAPLVLGL